MEIEIMLDVDEADPKDLPEIEKRFQAWFRAGAEARYGRPCYEYLAAMDKPYRYQVDLGQADFVKALQDLHGKLYRFRVKTFIHFIY